MTFINDSASHKFSFDSNESTKTLGIDWQPSKHTSSFKVSFNDQLTFTKEDVLSVIAKLYDLIDFLEPVISTAKIFLLKLWTCNLNTDDQLPEPLAKMWSNFVSQLKDLENVKIDRFFLNTELYKIAIIRIGDSSTATYNAAIYLQTSSVHSMLKLLTRKSRIAPLKTTSIP